MRFGIKILIICVVFVKINRYQVMQNTIVRTSYLYSQSEQPSKGGCRLPKTGENIYKRKDGRWEARFISGRKPDGCAKYTSVYARTYAAAKAKLEERKRMVVSRPAGSCRLTVKELFVWYLSQAEIKPSTRARYVFLIEHHILPELGSIFVVSLTAKQLSDFLSQKRQSGRLHGGGLSAKSVRDIGVLIKAALRFASAEYVRVYSAVLDFGRFGETSPEITGIFTARGTSSNTKPTTGAIAKLAGTTISTTGTVVSSTQRFITASVPAGTEQTLSINSSADYLYVNGVQITGTSASNPYSKTDLSKFADAKDISTWALPYMKAMVAAGYVHGRTQGLVPQANITRAEFAQLYFNIIQSYIAKSGSYTKDYKGNLLVRTKDVELKDMTIDGDLIIGNGVADGKVTLSNVKISGRLVVWGGGTAAIYCNDGTTAAEVIACRVDGPVKVIFDRGSTLLVYDKIKTRITERAGKFPETEIVFYAMDDLLNAQRDLNKMVDENLIQAEIPAHLYAIVGEQTVSATLKNSSKTDTYTIEIRRDSDGSLIADPITLTAGASVSSIMLKEAPEYGNAACTATITATRDGKTVGTLEVKTALHAAYLWPKEVSSK